MADNPQPPSTTTDNDAAAPASLSTSRHKAPEQTVHMNILGRDAEDLEQHASEKDGVMKDASPTTTTTTTRSRRTVNKATMIGSRVEPGLDSTSVSGGSSHSQQKQHDSMAASRALSPTTTQPAAAPAPLSVSRIDTPPNPRQVPKSWFARLSWGGGDEGEDVHTTDYECLEAPELAAQAKRKGKKTTAAASQQQQQPMSAIDSNNSTTSNATVEDQLKQDASFFFQGVQNNILGRNRDRKMRVNTEAQQQRRRPLPTSSLAAMSRQRVMTSRDGALFMNKYDQLNQDMIFGDSDEEYDDDEHNYRNHRNDLFLDEEVEFGSSPTGSYHEHNPGPTNNVVTDGLRTSSLFYEQDGRVLMKLPRDQVRLIMDPDLGAGILSVEQWRTREDMEQEYAAVQEQLEAGAVAGEQGIDPLMTKGGGQQPADDVQSQETTKVVGVLSNMHELNYVMTVPEDLYQRVVSEISAEAFPPYWGFFKCCNQDQERADIKLAVVILAFVMFLLLIGSIEWPTD